MRVPVGGREEAYFELLYFAFGGGSFIVLAVGEGGVDLPKGDVAAVQLLTLVGNIEHIRRFDNARVPQVADALLGILACGGDHDAVGGLHHVALFGLVLPTESRLGGGQRLATVLLLHGEIAQLDAASA